MLVSELKADAFALFAALYLRQTNILLHTDPTTAAMNGYTYQHEIQSDSRL